MLRVVDPADSKSTIPLDGRLGTRSYGAGAVVVASASTAWSAAIAAGVTEVLLHAKTACFVLEVVEGDDTITSATGIPLESGEKFHMRVSPGHYIAVLRESVDGDVHIIPVS